MDRTILIVEDNEDTRLAYADFLGWHGYRIVEAVNGAEALDVADREEPDLVLLDLALPVLDGWEVARRLRAPGRRRVPIVLVTAHLLPGDDERLRDAACDAYLSKPCDPQQLLDTIESLFTPAPARR